MLLNQPPHQVSLAPQPRGLSRLQFVACACLGALLLVGLLTLLRDPLQTPLDLSADEYEPIVIRPEATADSGSDEATLPANQPTLAAAAGTPAVPIMPVQRLIVPDLTAKLQNQLTELQISTLIVLADGPTRQVMHLNWGQLAVTQPTVTAAAGSGAAVASPSPRSSSSLAQLLYAASPPALKQVLQQLQREHQHDFKGGCDPATTSHLATLTSPLGRHKGHSSSLRAAGALRSSAVTSITTSRDSTNAGSSLAVALLVNAVDGEVRLQQQQLAAAAAAQLQHCLAATIAYGNYSSGKGDSLILFDATGRPVKAAFLATNIFRDAFSAIYDTHMWGSGEHYGEGSGLGSSLNYTSTLRAALPGLIARYHVTSMLDSSCGSFHWMPTVLRQVMNNTASEPAGFRFKGTDVACSVIGNLSAKYKQTEPAWSFDCIDYANQPLPTGFDLVFSRDSLQHLPMHAAWMFLNNVKASGARLLLVGSYIKAPGNPNFNINKPGEVYFIDLLRPPFNVTQPLEIIDEQTEDGKHMLLFDVQNMSWQDPLMGLV